MVHFLWTFLILPLARQTLEPTLAASRSYRNGRAGAW